MANQPAKRTSAAWYATAAIIIIIIIVAAVLAYQYTQSITPTPSPSPTASGSPAPPAGNMTITVYSGDVNLSTYGFGDSPSNITSPGPTFTVKAGTTVTVDFNNAGAMAHNWALVTEKTDGSTLLAFTNSVIGSRTNPIPSAGKGSTTFVASTTGTYYYICQVDEHVSLGMWGHFIVTQ